MKLYVDQILLNGIVGLVDSANKIAYNNNQIGKKMTENLTDSIIEHQQGAILGYVGRYIFYTQIILDDHSNQMTFIDLKKDEVMTQDIAKSFFDADPNNELFVATFLRMFYNQLKEYDKIYNTAELVIETPPTQ